MPTRGSGGRRKDLALCPALRAKTGAPRRGHGERLFFWERGARSHQGIVKGTETLIRVHDPYFSPEPAFLCPLGSKA